MGVNLVSQYSAYPSLPADSDANSYIGDATILKHSGRDEYAVSLI